MDKDSAAHWTAMTGYTIDMIVKGSKSIIMPDDDLSSYTISDWVFIFKDLILFQTYSPILKPRWEIINGP